MTAARIAVGITGGIAAYKACALIRLLKKAGADVVALPTPAALEMVGSTTLEALTGHPVHTRVSAAAHQVTHIRHAQESDLIVVAPATANTIAKVRWGMADNLLTNTILAARCPVMMAPAMHTEMWLNPATQDNVAVLRERGIDVLDVGIGRLTGADSGPGRMLEPEQIAEEALARLSDASSLAGAKIAISAGGTREPLDPVRFLGNRSSGHFGAELARAALARGAEVALVAANVGRDVLERARGARIEKVETARELLGAMEAEAATADVVIMCAAVADYRPEERLDTKRKKTGEGLSISLVENPDILASLAADRRREGQIVVGFAAETGDAQASALEYGIAKARRKGADLLIVNEVGEKLGFGDVDTAISIVSGDGKVLHTAKGSKSRMAQVILDAVRETMSKH